MKGLKGIIPPLVTPFDERDEIDSGALRSEISFVKRAGVHGLAVCGSTGEGHTLSDDEVRAVSEIACEEAGDLPVVVGVIVNSTYQALRRVRLISDLPIAALMVTPPHYLFPPTADQLRGYFRAICEQSGRSVLVYNVVPWCYLKPHDLICLMEEEDRVIGVKQSAGDLHSLATLISQAPSGRLIFTAIDDLLYPSFVLGADGAIAGICTAQPFWSVGLWESVEKGDHQRALEYHRKLLRLWQALEGPDFPARVKGALILQGVRGGRPRRPLAPSALGEELGRIGTALWEG